MENRETETQSNEDQGNLLTPKEYLKDLLSKAEIEVVEDTGVMRTILDEGKRVQKMAAKYGTSQDIGSEESFSGFGTYVVSVNEENARHLGIKIASKKYGGTFYVGGQPFDEFLREKNFSPYWASRMGQFKDHNVEYLADDFLRANVGGNPALEKERDTLSTLFSLGLVEYKRARTFLYSVDIPDNDSTNYLLYASPIGIENANRINGRLERMDTEWRVTRNDIGRNVYFNTLAEKVFGGSQERASRFLKETGYVGMEMNPANYIVFNDKDMKVTNRVQYMIDGENNVYGFAYDGKVYVDPEISTSSTYAHEYTHLWDAFTRRTNPELWEKGKDIFKGTSLWNEVMADENYRNLSNDDDILSECHSRIVGRMAEKVLERIAEKNGGLLRGQAIDWDNEVAEFVASELGAEFPKPELGSESYISDSVRHEIAREFLSRPMKDLMEGRKIVRDVPFQNIIRKMAEEHAFPDVREYFKFNRTDNENFGKALDKFDGLNPLQLIKVGEIPPVMKALGISDNPIEMPQSVVSKALREEAVYPNDKKGHALTMEHIKRIPESLADPIMVFKSRTRDDSYVFFTEQKDDASRSVIIPVAVDKRYGRLVINEITSIYGRTNEVDFVKTNIEQGNLVYADKKRSLEWERECQVQFLAQVLPSEGSYSSILTKENLVNFISAVGNEKNQKMAMSVENENHERMVLADPWGANFIAPSYWTHDDIEQWKELAQSHDMEVVSLLEFPYYAAKIISGEEKLESVNNLINLTLPERIESMEQLVAEEKRSRRLAYEHLHSGQSLNPATEHHEAESLSPQGIEMSAENEKKAPKEKKIEVKGADGKISEIRIAFGKTAVAKFAMVTQDGLKSYSGMTVADYEKTTDSYLLISEDKSQQVRVQSSTMVTLLSDERQREIEKTNSQIEENKKTGKSTENLEAKKEMLEQGVSVAQYNDFFQTRENCANNFRHNLSVMCRKEANSPLDALKIANKIITQMPDSEKVKTRDLLDLLKKNGQTRNEVLVDVYNEAVKETPLNEQYLLSQRYDKMIARPMYDTISGSGEKIDGNFNLKVGDMVKMTFNVDKDIAFKGTRLEREKAVFGRKEVMISECKIISSSKEGNVVTLMDGNKSFYDVPRDTFLKEYARHEKYEKRQERKEAHKKHIMRLDIER